MILNHRRDEAVHFLKVQIHTTQKSPLGEFNRQRASFLEIRLESLEVRPHAEMVAVVMMMPGWGHR